MRSALILRCSVSVRWAFGSVRLGAHCIRHFRQRFSRRGHSERRECRKSVFFFPRIQASNTRRTRGSDCPTAETTDRALVASEKTPPRSTIPLCPTTRSLLPLHIDPGCRAVAERCNLSQIAVTLKNCRNLSQTCCKALQPYSFERPPIPALKKDVQNSLPEPLSVGPRIFCVQVFGID